MLLPSRHVKYPTKVKDSLQKNLIPFHIRMSTSFKEELLLVADFKRTDGQGNVIVHWATFMTLFLAHFFPCTPYSQC